jgi:ABC-type spermidine/putrescine transport system permease subunit II
MHCLPLAVIIAMRSIGTTSPSWANAAAVHGVPLRLYFGRILVPHLLPAMLLAALLCALIATADVSTILLLHPPGETSLPLAIFTVMANAPESLVGALCLAYLGGAAVLMCLAAALARFARDTS